MKSWVTILLALLMTAGAAGGAQEIFGVVAGDFLGGNGKAEAAKVLGGSFCVLL